ncbi:MAG TPA: 3-phosphoserine/phosphohydroxythreonine transaminase [Candidatus Egerieicola pullicola]|uniref:Phosphoserine aminotransferase n=1 Tax=Candidatus Egerieicola pullicola TaxID=2840775 RepID=A0A9D1AKS1_9FIRM|nr:3-phosphoserine/phosphohydroxythreonine transaminase [Candidatus Egerieicola pullicola]
MSRVYNFSAGPSMLPQAVLEKAASEMLDYQGSGQSVMEMSHRSKTYQAIIDEAEALLREVLNIPDNYKVLFLQGGGSTQFAMIPLNLKKNGKADYVITGQWAKKAAAEARKYLDVNVVASSADTTFTYIPKLDPATFSKDADYFYICLNNTIYGTHYSPEQLPDTGDIPLVTDASSCILSEPMDVSKFGLIFAGAQKNMGPAGVTVVIIRDDLIREVPETVPTMLTYKIHADNGSMYNTPPCYSIYMVKLVLEWLKNDIGGVEKMHEINKAKAAKLYEFLDNSKLFKGTVEKDSRSLMNVPFVTGDKDLDAKFVAEAAKAGLVNLKGHRTVGGMRASIYNAMPMEGVDALIDFMKKFEAENA